MTGPLLKWGGGRLDGTAWQGILYLSIELPPTGTVRARVTAHLNRVADNPAAAASWVTEEDVVVEGGRRITGLAYDVQITGSTVVLSFSQLGDHSAYRVTLRPLGNPELKVHPFFASDEFRFTIDCEGGDCREQGMEARAAPAQRPVVDLLTKDYHGFLRLLTDWVKVHNPHWADLSSASFERVLVELLAWQGDMLSYYQDRVANEAFIDTASQRSSLRQHATLLGTRLFDGSAARTVLAFDVTSSGFVPAGLEVRTAATPDESPVVFSVIERAKVVAENNSDALTVAAFPGAHDARIPEGAQQFLLWGQGASLRAGDRLAFVQGEFSQVVTLTEVQQLSESGWVEHPDDTFDPATDVPHPLTKLTWSEPLTRSLSPWDVLTPLRLYANLVDARHGKSRTAWVEPETGSARPKDVRIRLTSRNSIVARQVRGAASVHQLRALQVPDAPVLHESEGAGSAPALEVIIDNERWTRTEHLHGSRSYDAHYTAEAEEDGSVWIRFGDGIHGREVAVARDEARGFDGPVAPIVLRYRVGDPISGNVGFSTLREVIRPATGTDEEAALSTLGHVQVTNVLPGTGGLQPQSLAQVREAIPMALRHGTIERAVSLADYAQVAMQDPGVARAAARALGGVFNTVLILVDPKGSDEASPELLARVEARIDEVRMAGREHFVARATYAPLEVSLLLCIQAGFAAHEVRERVLTELRPGTTRRPGWFHPDRLSFGESVRLGDVIAFVQGLPGVRAVKATLFRRLGDVAAEVREVIALGLTEVARLDADPDFPENGILEVQVADRDLVPDEQGTFSVDVPELAGALT